MSGLLFQTNDARCGLIDRLSRSPLVRSLGPEEAETLAHAFSDLEETFRKLLDECFPKLANPSIQGEELDDLLLDISEEFRHVLYHIHDPRLFRVMEPTHTWLAVSEEEADGDT